MATNAMGGDLYRWTDAQGRVQVSDTPPVEPARNLQRQTPAPSPTPQQYQQAMERAARDRVQLQKIEEERLRAEAQAYTYRAPASAAVPAPSAPGTQPDCAERLRRYQSSEACYGPYRTARGGIKPEAFSVCGPALLDPSRECVRRTP